jgi:hypothetical protein
MYARDWIELSERVGELYSDFNWEYVFVKMRDISNCLLETMWNELDSSICFEGIDGYLLIPDGPGGPPPNRRGFLGGFGSDWDCPEHLFINADKFVSAGWTKGTLRLLLRMRIFQCDRTIRYTIFGSKESMTTLGLLTPKKSIPTEAMNAFVDGINASRRVKPIVMSLLTWEESKDNVKTKVTWELM